VGQPGTVAGLLAGYKLRSADLADYLSDHPARYWLSERHGRRPPTVSWSALRVRVPLGRVVGVLVK